MNKIEEITITNVKGKCDFILKFDELYANYPNLLIAPNGFGKSTLAVAFESLKPNKLELKKEDYYKEDDSNKPSIKIKMDCSSGSKLLTADTSMNEISKTINTFVINSPIYAKSTSRRIGKYSTSSAVLDVEDLILVENIPLKVEIDYKIKNIKSRYPQLGNCVNNLGDLFKNIDNLRLFNENSTLFSKCASQVRPTKAMNSFIEIVSSNMSSIAISGKLSSQNLKVFSDNNFLHDAVEVVRNIKCSNIDFQNDLNIYIATIQIINVIKDSSVSISDTLKYMEYVEFKKSIDSRLKDLNSTGRTIKTKATKNKLVICFLAANKMSNGERDVLSFISNLSKFEIMFTKKIGILIIDEIFDYLDGANMLIVQYYLSNLINEYKKNGKILFPLLLTHLDPTLFGNYYFKKPKIHYLKESSYIKDDKMLRFLRVRSNKGSNQELIDLIEKYYLHYYPKDSYVDNSHIIFPDDVNYGTSTDFYTEIHIELNKYLTNSGKYDPLKVICAIRVLVEKIAYNKLFIEAEKEEYLATHTTSQKLNFLIDKNVEVEEVLYLLQPLYNDALHMDENSHSSLNKIRSTCLKLENVIVQKIVKSLIL